ncbi:MAG: isocitrate lyase/PEP mutase family protein [Burkholderiales bacterium]|nr:isocitrate lyase/PEP mutase family protein [Burkholderiales bacterium]
MIIAPGISDAFGARLVQQSGFEVAYLGGNSMSALLLGKPDFGLVDLTLVTQHAHRVASCVDIPVICDADTGFGNVVNVRHTVEEFEAAGVAAIHIEDQVSPKRCGHMPGSRHVIDFGEAIRKIEVAVAARRDPDFVIIARTDAAPGLGLDEAIRRARAFREAGADVCFVELKTTPTVLEDLRRVTESVNAPCLVNVDGGGKLGQLSKSQIEAAGLRIAIYPGLGRYAAGFAIREALQVLKRDGDINVLSDRMLTMQQYDDVLGAPDFADWERKHLH